MSTEIPFKQGELVFSKLFRPLMTTPDWDESHEDDWQQLIQDMLRKDESYEPIALNCGTPCIIAEQLFKKNRWIAFVITPKGNGWVKSQDLARNDRPA